MTQIDHERRAQRRIRLAQVVPVEYPDYQPRLRDLNLGGAFIEDPRPIPRGRVIQVRFYLGNQSAVQGRAMVRRVEPDVGMAVEFIEMNHDDRNRLREFLASIGNITPSEFS